MGKQLLSPRLDVIKEIINTEGVSSRITIWKDSYETDIYYDVDSNLLMRLCQLCHECQITKTQHRLTQKPGNKSRLLLSSLNYWGAGFYFAA